MNTLNKLLLGLLVAVSFLASSTGLSQIADSFAQIPDGHVYSIAIQTDGKVLVGGGFDTVNSQPRGHLARLNADGTLDTGFNPGPDDLVSSIAIQADNKIVIGGDFGVLAGGSRMRVACLETNGLLDPIIFPGVDNFVWPLVLQTNGGIIIGGAFGALSKNFLNGPIQTRNRIARINTSGNTDILFNPGANNYVLSLAVQPDGKILVGGGFTQLGGVSRNYIGRLNTSSSGSVDGFNPNADNWVFAMTVQPDGKVLVGGGFSMLGSYARSQIGRLNSDGTVDVGFNPGCDGVVFSFALQADGKIIVGGRFTMLGGQPRDCIGRLNPDGTLDPTFNPGASGGQGAWPEVNSLAIQADGKIIVGGWFTNLAGRVCNDIGRLNNTLPATQSLAFDGTNITWLRGGASPEVWRATFELSTNSINWTNLGNGLRIEGGWRLAGVSLLSNSIVRARGYVAGTGYLGNSAWFVESVYPQVRPAIFLHDGFFGFNSNSFGFNLSGNAGSTLVVERSTNLSFWLPVSTNTLNSGPLYFSELRSTNIGACFYRARLK